MAKYQIIRSKKAISYLLNRRNFVTLEKRDNGFISQKDVDDINEMLRTKKLAKTKAQGAPATYRNIQ